MWEQPGENKLITFIGGVRDGEIKIVDVSTIEIRSIAFPDIPSHTTDDYQPQQGMQKELLYREEPPGSCKFYLKSERLVKDED